MSYVIFKLFCKLVLLFNFICTVFVKIYLLIFKKVDFSLLADFKIWQIKGINIGNYSKIGAFSIFNTKSRGGGINIGKKVDIKNNVSILTYGGHISIGDGTSINPYCILYGHGGLKIGKNCLIASNNVFIPANHNFKEKDKTIREQGEVRIGITVGDNVWFGTGCRILDGVTIGDNVVVGAGSVIVKDVPSNSLVVGVPGKVIKNI